MEILKAKVTKDNTLTASYRDENGTTTVEGKNLVTNDLKDAFNSLTAHLAFLCEQKEADGKECLEDLPKDIDKKLEVTGYTIGGEDESRGVALIGKRFLKSNKVLNLNSPFTKFDDENEHYQFGFELEQAIQACEYEVNEYLFNKKWKVVQQELPFADDAPASDVVPDDIQEAATDMPENPDMKDFQAVMDNSTVTIEIGGKKMKPRKQRAKQLAS